MVMIMSPQSCVCVFVWKKGMGEGACVHFVLCHFPLKNIDFRGRCAGTSKENIVVPKKVD